MKLWEAPVEVKTQVDITKTEFPHLAQARFWVLCSDAKPLRNNRLALPTIQVLSPSERIKTEADFKLVIVAESWGLLTDDQQKSTLHMTLSRISVKYRRATQVVNKKTITIKDDLGRVMHTDEVELDSEGRPKWFIAKPDVEVYFAHLKKQVSTNDTGEEFLNLKKVMAGTEPTDYTLVTKQADVGGSIMNGDPDYV